ncbi:MAG: triose-phosphate isomerase [Candidatus Portnoybacteria bacterium]|nr:triose-phosphate isomerase [Candidatus Portnoybacteria bacterium]
MISVIAQKVDIYAGDGKHPFARTGDLSFYHLTKAGATGILVGHSEVGEGAEAVNKKLKAAHGAGLQNNIVLLGEEWNDMGKPWGELNDEEKKRVGEVVKKKFLTMIEGISGDIISHTVFSYEPGWGVRGSGKSDVPPPQVEQIEVMARMLRGTIKEKYNETVSNSARITYGGSMSPERANELMPLEDIDGFILGSAGTKTEWVKKIARAVKQYKKDRTPVLALNWKAYELEESYEKFLEVLKPFEKEVDIYLAPAATELSILNSKIKMQISK